MAIGLLGAFLYASAGTLAQRLSGYILLQVQSKGEAWYVDPVTLTRIYLKDGNAAYDALREFGLGIKNVDLNKIPVGVEARFNDIDSDSDGLADKLEEGIKTDPAKADTDSDGISDGLEILTNNTNPLGSGELVYDAAIINRLNGRILLQVESRGEAWYLNPKDKKKYYMKDGEAAYQIMRYLSLGITNSDLSQIPINEDFQADSTEEKPMTRGTADPDFMIEKYDESKTMDGTTLLADNHNTEKPRIIEINMLGEIIWEYDIPSELIRYNNPGFDVELLPNNNILFVLPGNGVYEINRDKQTVWSYQTTKISHDADRLDGGNTIFVFGNNDSMNDSQVTEVNKAGEIIWSWYAKNHYNTSSYNTISDQGWTHANAVTRVSNGNTLISLRNFNLVAEVDHNGDVVNEYGRDVMVEQHDPVALENGNLLFANHGIPEKAVEINLNSEIVWEYAITNSQQWPVRDADRLSNGNTLITTTTKIIEVTPNKEIVWSFAIKDTSQFTGQASAGLGFYKAERITE